MGLPGLFLPSIRNFNIVIIVLILLLLNLIKS
jgi:hypothetical protein